jgi:two-component system response regulator NreC
MTISVILADDHAMVRDGLRRVLDESEDITVVGEAADGEEAVSIVERLRPRVVLLDISMPGLNGMEAARRIKQQCPEVAAVFLTMHESEQYFVEALRCGAEGYVPKSAPASDVVEAVHVAARGQVYLHPSVARFLLQTLLEDEPHSIAADAYASLTPREREVLRLVAGGMTNRDIAERLALSAHTVHRHRTSLMQKLGLHNRLELLRYCMQRGLLPP